MAFDESLATRIRDALARTKNVEEKRMFGGIGFLLNGNLLVAVRKDTLLVRLGQDRLRRRCGSRTSPSSRSRIGVR
jgi:TfoX/Sxy family transcriptional regulator of competence genes